MTEANLFEPSFRKPLPTFGQRRASGIARFNFYR